jgi:hypothetical protein
VYFVQCLCAFSCAAVTFGVGAAVLEQGAHFVAEGGLHLGDVTGFHALGELAESAVLPAALTATHASDGSTTAAAENSAPAHKQGEGTTKQGES